MTICHGVNFHLRTVNKASPKDKAFL